jgi:hypothetical protein
MKAPQITHIAIPLLTRQMESNTLKTELKKGCGRQQYNHGGDKQDAHLFENEKNYLLWQSWEIKTFFYCGYPWNSKHPVTCLKICLKITETVLTFTS